MTRTRSRSTLGLLLALLPLSGSALADDFSDGVKAFQNGEKEAALAHFQAALASDPSNEDAYEWFKATSHDIWLDMMVEGGEFELIAKRFMERARLGSAAMSSDADAIKDLVRSLRAADNVVDVKRIERQIAAQHGEYAVPHIVFGLADQGDSDWNIRSMLALQHMDASVVLPLMEVLHSDDVFQRINTAHVLGHIGDPRAGGVLRALASSDPDPGVAEAAGKAAASCGAGADALTVLLSQGDMYHRRDAEILRSFDYSDVVWNWVDGNLVASSIPRSVYPDLLAKKAFHAALAVDPQSMDALAGIARANVNIRAKLAGSDAADAADEGLLAVLGAGSDAVDLALQWSVRDNDGPSAVGLCRVLGELAVAPTAGLETALTSGEGPVSGEAAIALAHIAARSGSAAGARVVETLGAAAAQEIVRFVAVIDADSDRSNQVKAGLDANTTAIGRGDGISGLTLLRTLPGLDAIVVGDGLTDVTLDAVLDEIEDNSAMSDTPVFLLTGNSELADDYADRTAGSISDAADLSALAEALSADLTGDRADADEMSRRAADALAAIAASGSDISGALDGLAAALGRADEIAIAAASALGAQGNLGQVDTLTATVADGSRSDAVRVACADGLAGIFGRHQVDAGNAAGLVSVVSDSGNSLAVRGAAARALGRANLTASDRAGLLRDVRVDPSTD